MAERERMRKFIERCQKEVNWDDKILLPLQPHLYIVEKPEGARVIKCDCEREFGDYRNNWKLEANVIIRDTTKAMREIYPPLMHAEPEWMVLREFFCPGCFRLLEVEAVPPGYPIIHDFQPDLEGFLSVAECGDYSAL